MASTRYIFRAMQPHNPAPRLYRHTLLAIAEIRAQYSAYPLLMQRSGSQTDAQGALVWVDIEGPEGWPVKVTALLERHGLRCTRSM
jgi:hypothetical protein